MFSLTWQIGDVEAVTYTVVGDETAIRVLWDVLFRNGDCYGIEMRDCATGEFIPC